MATDAGVRPSEQGSAATEKCANRLEIHSKKLLSWTDVPRMVLVILSKYFPILSISMGIVKHKCGQTLRSKLFYGDIVLPESLQTGNLATI
jgi:hypothetical protein